MILGGFAAGGLTPQAPALRPSHSRTLTPPYDPDQQQVRDTTRNSGEPLDAKRLRYARQCRCSIGLPRLHSNGGSGRDWRLPPTRLLSRSWHLAATCAVRHVQLVAFWISHNHVGRDAIPHVFMDNGSSCRHEALDRFSHLGLVKALGAPARAAGGPQANSATAAMTLRRAELDVRRVRALWSDGDSSRSIVGDLSAGQADNNIRLPNSAERVAALRARTAMRVTA